MKSIDKNTFNPKDIVFVDLRLQNGQVDLILRAIELYGYNLKYMIGENPLNDEERSEKEAKLQATYNLLLSAQAEQVNSKADLHDSTTKLAENMQNNSNIIKLPSEKAI